MILIDVIIGEGTLETGIQLIDIMKDEKKKRCGR